MTTAEEVAAPRGREYETIYVLKPDVTRDGSERVAKRVQEVMERETARLTLVETWGRRSLAYRIKKYRYGIYVYLRYIGQQGVVEELERNFRMLDDVMRYQSVLVSKELAADLQVDPADVQFEEVEGQEEELSDQQALARELGLVEAPEAESGSGNRGGDDSDDDDERGGAEEDSEEEDE